ncbi:MAG: alkaline phosphatase family protein [Candidatus Eisenbacteria bacterium]
MVVLLVDALGWELASAMPGFAVPLAERRRLDTILGFSSGALPTLFTGRMPAEHGRWLMYRRATGATPFAGFGALAWLPARVRQSLRASRWLTRLVAQRGVRGYFHLYDVPRPLLEHFDLPEREDIFLPGGLPGVSLWDSLERRGVPWRGWNWRTPETANLAALEDRLAHGDERLLFCYTADLDALLHREGSRGAGVGERLRRYDAVIGRLLAAAEKRGEHLWLYLLSDHGMVDVTGHCDVMGALAGLAMRWPGDYLAFFDSTLARFWWRAPGARQLVMERLARLPGGRWLDRDELRRASAPEDPSWGEDVFLLDPGQLLVPSFMGRGPLAAMHGYDPAHPDMAALLWSNRPVPDSVRHLRDVRGHLEAELDALGREAAA